MKNPSRKLSLNKQTLLNLSELNDTQLREAAGAGKSTNPICAPSRVCIPESWACVSDACQTNFCTATHGTECTYGG